MADDLLARARDAGYTAVGFGVLAVQRLQVRRRELTKGVVPGEVLKRVVRQADAVVEPVLDGVERLLPQPARQSFHRARRIGRAFEQVLLG